MNRNIRTIWLEGWGVTLEQKLWLDVQGNIIQAWVKREYPNDRYEYQSYQSVVEGEYCEWWPPNEPRECWPGEWSQSPRWDGINMIEREVKG